MKVIFIGDSYYKESKSTMGSVYQITDTGSLERTNWGVIQIALQEGEEVYIRPANKKELKQMDNVLEQIKRYGMIE